MIGWLKGLIIDNQQPGKLVVDVNGVGYDVETSLSTFFQVETQTTAVGLFIHTVVREDAFLLYGFIDKTERQLFRELIKVNGVGPKLAIAILSSMMPHDFVACINQENVQALVKLPGIGRKTAERLVVEMKDSLKTFQTTQHTWTMSSKAPATHEDEAISALEALGYKFQEAKKVVARVSDGQQNCEQLIRLSLRELSKA